MQDALQGYEKGLVKGFRKKQKRYFEEEKIKRERVIIASRAKQGIAPKRVNNSNDENKIFYNLKKGIHQCFLVYCLAMIQKKPYYQKNKHPNIFLDKTNLDDQTGPSSRLLIFFSACVSSNLLEAPSNG